MRIELPCYDIVVVILEGGVSRITDGLHETTKFGEDPQGTEDFNHSVDGITSLILAHACAGIDITTPAYIEGIETAVEACLQNC